MTDPILSEHLDATKSTRLDLLVFLGAFVTGLALYFALRLSGVSQVYVTMVVVGVMLLYALVVGRVPRLRVRLDQAGDNAYYLGLLFTLLSMSVALYEFGIAEMGHTVDTEGDAARQVIGNFGTALGTTIAGIFLRVMMHQMRVDPADVEGMTRIELADAASKVKATLNNLSVEFGRTLDEVRQRGSDEMERLVDATGDAIRAVATAAAERIKETGQKVAEAHGVAIDTIKGVAVSLDELGTVVEEAGKRVAAVEPPPQQFVAQLERANAAIAAAGGHMANLAGRLAEGIGRTEVASAALAEGTARLTTSLEAVQAAHEMVVRSVREAGDGAASSIRDLGSAVDEERRKLVDLDAAVRQSIVSAERAESAAILVLARLTDMARELVTVVRAGTR